MANEGRKTDRKGPFVTNTYSTVALTSTHTHRHTHTRNKVIFEQAAATTPPMVQHLKSSCRPVTFRWPTEREPRAAVMRAIKHMSQSWETSTRCLPMLLYRFMFTLKDSSRPPCPPFSSLSSSPAWPRPSAAWLCLCSSSWRLSSSAARVLPWNQFTHKHKAHVGKHQAGDYRDDYGRSWGGTGGVLGCFECGCANVCHL